MKVLNKKIWDSLSIDMRTCICNINDLCNDNTEVLLFDANNDISEELECTIENYNLEWHAGASKLCLIDDNSDYVVKIPLIYQADSYDKDGYPEVKWNGDYIEEDVWVYEHYLEKSLLAKNIPLVQFDNQARDSWGKNYFITIYVQDKCLSAEMDDDSEYITYHSPKSKELAESRRHPFSHEWIDRFCKFYGENAAESFLDNWKRGKNTLTDMCSRNYGYTYNEGLPIIFDYSGYGCLA